MYLFFHCKHMAGQIESSGGPVLACGAIFGQPQSTQPVFLALLWLETFSEVSQETCHATHVPSITAWTRDGGIEI